jgi:hypothetical protein
MSGRKLTCLLFSLALIAAPPLLASPGSTSAFKKLLSLGGQWEGKDEHGMAVKTTFKAMASDTHQTSNHLPKATSTTSSSALKMPTTLRKSGHGGRMRKTPRWCFI